MAKTRPFTTYYSDGTQGRATTAAKAAIRAFKHVIEGRCKTAQVQNQDNECIVEIYRRYGAVQATIYRRKELK